MNQSKEKIWIDEQGRKVPFVHVGKAAKIAELGASKLLKEAQFISKRMTTFKGMIDEISDNVINAVAASFNGRKPSEKGNYTWYNFDRSIKVSVSVNDFITFDDITIQMSKEKLNEFLDSTLNSETVFIKDLVQDAFATSKGKLDVKKVMSLTRYRSKIDNPLFQEALNLLEAAIRKPSSTEYFKIYTRNDDGSYKLINLNFSSI